MRLAVTFAEPSEIQMEVGPDVPIRTEYEMSTQLFMDGKPPNGVPDLKGVDARRMVVDMLRQGWETLAQSRGLRRHEMSERTSWYMPEGLLPQDWGRFVDENGKRGRRKLVGIRGRRKVRYHFAVSARPQVLPFPRLIIRSHVVFTEGGAVVTQKNAAQRNRKALCKNWWNLHWRDRQYAMLAFIAGESGTFDLPLGGTVATVCASPMLFEAPCSYIRHAANESGADDEEQDDFDEALADLDADDFSPDDHDE